MEELERIVADSNSKYILNGEAIKAEFANYRNFCRHYKIESNLFYRYKRTDQPKGRLISQTNAMARLPKKYLKRAEE